MKLIVGTMKRLDDDQRTIVLDHLGASIREEIRRAPGLAWLRVEVAAQIHRSVNLLGPAGARQFWRTTNNRALETNAFSPLRGAASRMFGSSPAGFLKFAPHSYKLVTRSCGRITVLGGDDGEDAEIASSTLTYYGFPPELPLSLVRPMLLGTPESVLDYLGFEGACLHQRESSEELAVRVQWQQQRLRGEQAAA